MKPWADGGGSLPRQHAFPRPLHLPPLVPYAVSVSNFGTRENQALHQATRIGSIAPR